MPVTLNPETWINWEMAKAPLNWVIVGTVASIWLIAFHSVMTGFTAMQGSGGQAIGGGAPGTIAAPLAPSTVGAFSVPGSTGSNDSFAGDQWFSQGRLWTDSYDARYAEDGWTGDNT